MTDQAVEVKPASPGSSIRELASSLRQQYPRAAHRGRLDQIEQLLTSVAGLADELPAEEEREAELEQRLLKHYRDGNWKGPSAEHGVTHTSDAADRLADALSRQES